MIPRPVYLLSPAAPDAVLRALVPEREIVHLVHSGELSGREAGLLLLPPELAPAQMVDALVRAAAAPAEASWLPVLVERSLDGGAARCLPLSLGWVTPPEELARWVGGDRDAKVLELRHALAQVARGRHDINNPLTSAMAETQLALMDATEPVVRSGLETIMEQLRRIRDLVAGLRSLRPPSEARRG